MKLQMKLRKNAVPLHATALAVSLLAGLLTTAVAQPAPGAAPAGPAPPASAAGMPPGPGAGAGGPPLPAGMPPMPPQEPVVYVSAAEIVDGRWLPADAKAGASVQGAGAAKGLKLKSTRDLVNGLYVHGKGKTALQGAQIEVDGRGRSDFDGIAAGVLVKEGASLELRDAKIVTRGVVASAATVTDQGTLRVLHSTLIAEGGPLPSGYTRRIGPGMMEPPTPLGLSGTARTTLAMGASKAYYADSTIIAEGWGALSTDAARGAELLAERCKIIVRRSGYGTYADNGASVAIVDSTMDVPTFGGVIAGQAALRLDGVKMLSHGNAVMVHSVMGQPQEVGTLKIRGGDIHTTNAAIVVKSANADIVLDGVKIRSDNGDLLLGVTNDDGFATKTQGQVVPGIRAVVQGSQLKGNLVHLDKDRTMQVRLVGSRLQGRVQGATLALDAGSRWTATADSQVTLDAGVTLAQLDAPAGVTIRVNPVAGGLPTGEHRLAGGGLLVVR